MPFAFLLELSLTMDPFFTGNIFNTLSEGTEGQFGHNTKIEENSRAFLFPLVITRLSCYFHIAEVDLV